MEMREIVDYDEEFIKDFCVEKSKDYKNLLPNLRKLHPEWSENQLAINLMEFGRGQISCIGVPNEKDINFFKRYLGSFREREKKIFLISAYLGGCVMGLVQKGHLSPNNFMDAMEVSKKIAEQESE